MRPLAALLGASVLVLAAPVAAQDGRIRDLTYAPGAVYRIDGAFRTATQIVFSPDETIRHAAIGDSVAWEVAAEGSVLFLKPRERHAPTNLLVVTDRGGEIRHYAFELTAGGGSGAVYQARPSSGAGPTGSGAPIRTVRRTSMAGRPRPRSRSAPSASSIPRSPTSATGGRCAAPSRSRRATGSPPSPLPTPARR